MKLISTIWACLVATSTATTPITEVMILFDASYSGVLGATVNTHLTQAWAQLREALPQARFAVSSFVDKPAPFVGLGVYGGYPNGRRIDWCYRLESPLSSDDEAAKAALKAISTGSGLDAPEGHFEAMIQAAIDDSVGWTQSARKAIVVFTDDYGHLGTLNSLASHVDLFSQPVHCDPKEKYTIGGFGAQSTYNELAGWVTADYDNGVSYGAYYELANLLNQHMCESQELTVEDLMRFEELREKLGPVEVPAVKPFDLEVMKTDPETHCREHEYPAFEDVVDVLTANDFSLVVVQVDASSSQSSAAQASVEATWVYTLDYPLSVIPNEYRHVYVASTETVSAAVIDALSAL